MSADPRGRRARAVRTAFRAVLSGTRTVLSGSRKALSRSRVAPSGDRAAVLVVFAAGVLAHVESLSYWFTSSDTIPLVESSRASGDPVVLVAGPMMAGTRFVDVALFYRPLATLSYTVDHLLWGLSPAGYHLTNILLHGLASVAAAVAIAVVTRRRAAGAVGGALFAVHPLTAEVVPAVSRRHDVLMATFLFGALALFVDGRESTGSDRSLAGSLALYALALLSKEPAVVFPGLVVAWVALDRERPASPSALLAGLRAALPFLLVTAGYLALRVEVLGGLGGYREPRPTDLADVAMILVEYLLSLWYPQGVVGAATMGWGGPAWRLVATAMAIAGVVVVVAGVATARRRGASAASFGAVAGAAAVGAVPAAVVLEPHLVRVIPLLYEYRRPSVVTAYPRPSSPVVGLLLVGALLAVAAWTLAGSSVFRADDRTALCFFGLWLAGPLVPFVFSGNFTVRSGYVSLAPAAGAIAVMLLAPTRRAGTGGGRSLAADLSVLGVALLVVVPLVATSPLAHAYDGWATSGEINRATLDGVREEVDGMQAGSDLRVEGLVQVITDRGCSFPRSKSVLYARPGTVESWLRLSGLERRVQPGGGTVLRTAPDRVRVARKPSNGTTTIRVSYAGVDGGACATTPWARYEDRRSSLSPATVSPGPAAR